jgi:hypothetical protein
MILTTYLVFVLVSFLSTIGNFSNKYLSGTLVFSGILIWSVLARLIPPNEDLEYYIFMFEQPELISSLLANFNEPILYLFLWTINNYLNNVFLTFVISDVFILLILYKSLFGLIGLVTGEENNIKIRRFYSAIFFILVISWPFYLGFHVTYRQFFATIIFLFALSKIQYSPIKAICIFILSGLIHNSLFLFAPILGFLLRNKFLSFLSILFSISLPVLLGIVSSTRASRDVGVILASLYPVTITLISLITIILVIGQKKNIERNLYVFLLYVPYASMLAWLFLGNGQAERFGLLSLSILLPIFLIFVSDRFKNKYIVYTCILIFVIFPMLTFYQGMLL